MAYRQRNCLAPQHGDGHIHTVVLSGIFQISGIYGFAVAVQHIQLAVNGPV